ncbi:hypothetical protein N9R29_01175 [Gammaproteobacteria bacterium]|nr:hypothetical protein [Gammaproteobacteria bacterium]
MQSKYPNKHDEAELVAEYICSRLKVTERYEINSQNQMVLPPKKPNDLLNLNRAIEAVHDIYVRDICEKALSSSGFGGIWESDSDVSRKSYIETYDAFASSETRDALNSLIELKHQVDWVLEDSVWDNYVNIENSSEMLWRHSIVMDELIDRFVFLARDYEKLPFSEKAFEADLLRCFFYTYVNSACRKYTNNLHYRYHHCHSATISGYESFLAVDGYEIQDLTGHANRSRSFFSDINFSFIWNSVFTFGAFVLPLWFFHFPAYTEREFYLAIFLGFYVAARIAAQYDKVERRRFKREKKIKTRLVNFSRRISLLLSFSVDRKPILIDTLLESDITDFKFGSERLKIPGAIKKILIRAAENGDETIG